jgi:hypothetical protein
MEGEVGWRGEVLRKDIYRVDGREGEWMGKWDGMEK